MRSVIRMFRATFSRKRDHRALSFSSPQQSTHAALAAIRADRALACKLCDAIDRAVALGLHQHADRLAHESAQLARTQPRLCERIARLKVAHGDLETAMAIIDACETRPASLRMLRAVCLMQLGRKLEAHLDLREWSRRHATPLDARRLLALLEWELGDHQAALEALHRNLHHLPDTRTLQMITLLHAHAARPNQRDAWSKALIEHAAASRDHATVEVLLRSLNIHPSPPASAARPANVATLATELLAAEPLIAALVEAQIRLRQPQPASLLYAAIELAQPDLNDQAGAFAALARLALVLNRPHDARRHAERSLELRPMSVSIARIVQELNAAERAAKPAIIRRGRAA